MERRPGEISFRLPQILPNAGASWRLRDVEIWWYYRRDVTRLQGIVPEMTGRLELIYRELLNCYGPQHWWPAEEPFEGMVGAVLTQSAAWVNVEKAISNLKRSGVLDPQSIREMRLERLALLIYSSGYYK